MKIEKFEVALKKAIDSGDSNLSKIYFLICFTDIMYFTLNTDVRKL